MDYFWVVFYQNTTDDEVASEMYIIRGDESDAQEMVLALTLDQMYEDFCFDYDYFVSNFREDALERALEYKTMEDYDDYGHRWHYQKAEQFIDFFSGEVIL